MLREHERGQTPRPVVQHRQNPSAAYGVPVVSEKPPDNGPNRADLLTGGNREDEREGAVIQHLGGL